MAYEKNVLFISRSKVRKLLNVTIMRAACKIANRLYAAHSQKLFLKTGFAACANRK